MMITLSNTKEIEVFKIEFETENDVFQNSTQDAQFEVARILYAVSKRLMSGDVCGPVSDVNGSKIGRFDLTLR